MQAGRRELVEETGYVGKVEVVGSMWLAENAMRRRWSVLATECEQLRPPVFSVNGLSMKRSRSKPGMAVEAGEHAGQRAWN